MTTKLWNVVVTTEVYESVLKRGRISGIGLAAIQEILEEDGPEALDLDQPDSPNFMSWSEIPDAHVARYVHNDGGRLYAFFIEIRPGQNIILREAGAKPLPK
ncbi:MAG TPA: hypothetical protein VGL66_06885 [Caulobacteraceae bacterium]|jgi:hypothetical protein